MPGDPRARPRRSVFIYDPGADTLTRAADLPEPRAEHRLADLGGGRFLLAGGYDASGAPARRTLIFEYPGDRWSDGPPLPEAVISANLMALIRLADGTLLLGNGFDAGAGECTQPNGRTYLLGR